MIEFMIAPFVACIILTGIHAYLGIHVIEREVIFVDLALAQIAALGASAAFLFGFHPDDRMSYFFSLGFTLIGAAIFSLTRFRKKKVPQEAIIGIVYAVSAAAMILMLDKTAQGAEHLKSFLIGSILFVSWKDILYIFVLYSAIGIIHFLYRKKFMAISMDSEGARKNGINIRLWDFIFYTSFGLVVTSSVRLAGVLLVFSYLIVPSVCAALLTKKLKNRLLTGWFTGTIVSIIGLYLSVMFDMPPGATVVCTFGIALLITGGYTVLFER